MTTYGISRPRPVTTKALALLVGATALMLAGVAYGTRPTEQRSAYEAEERSDVVKVAMAADSSSGSMDATVKEGVPDYHPQPRGKTRVRVRTTDRAGHTLPIPLVLSPDHVADTASPDPSLFWHIDSVPPAHVKIIFTLNQESRIEPLVEVQLPRVQRVGIQRIRLAEFGVKLDLGVEYNWSVALATGAGEWSGDVFTTGYIRRVAAPPEMNREQQPASVNTYASLGLWYDALEAASDAVDAAPADLDRLGSRGQSTNSDSQLGESIEPAGLGRAVLEGCPGERLADDACPLDSAARCPAGSRRANRETARGRSDSQPFQRFRCP